jgi:DNA repair protein RadC
MTFIATNHAEQSSKVFLDHLSDVPQILLSYRSHVPVENRPRIMGPFDTFRILRQHWDSSTIALYESFKILLVDGGLKMLGIVEIARGGIDGVAVDLRLVFSAALIARATGIVMAHNHPSGAVLPSQEDIDLTSRAKECGRILKIQIHDHIILTDKDYYSFVDKGIL